MSFWGSRHLCPIPPSKSATQSRLLHLRPLERLVLVYSTLWSEGPHHCRLAAHIDIYLVLHLAVVLFGC